MKTELEAMKLNGIEKCAVCAGVLLAATVGTTAVAMFAWSVYQLIIAAIR